MIRPAAGQLPLALSPHNTILSPSLSPTTTNCFRQEYPGSFKFIDTSYLPDLFSQKGRLLLIFVLQTGDRDQWWPVLTCGQYTENDIVLIDPLRPGHLVVCPGTNIWISFWQKLEWIYSDLIKSSALVCTGSRHKLMGYFLHYRHYWEYHSGQYVGHSLSDQSLTVSIIITLLGRGKYAIGDKGSWGK